MRPATRRPRRERPLVRVGASLGAIATMLVLAACSSGVEEPTAYATYEPSSAVGEGGDGALLSGTLRADGGCLVVETEDGTDVLPIFPADATTWDPATSTLTIETTTYQLGSQVSFGGGYTSSSDTSSSVPDACENLQESFIVTWMD